MRIWELAEKTWISRDTIRFYEKKWLINSSTWNESSNSYRDYHEDNITNIKQIQFMKKLGFTLAECEWGIRRRVNNEFTLEGNKKFLIKRIALVEEQIKELETIKSEFEKLYQEHCNGTLGHDCTKKRAY